MKTCTKSFGLILALAIALASCTAKKEEPKMAESKATTESSLAAKIRRFAPTDITADTSHLSEGDRKALDKLIEAAKILDPLYLRQAWSGAEALHKKLEADTTPEGRERLHYFMINKGPWSRLDKNEPFIDGVPHEKPPQAGFYPDDMTKDEFNSWVDDASRSRQAARDRILHRDSGAARTANSRSFLITKSIASFSNPQRSLLKEAADADHQRDAQELS